MIDNTFIKLTSDFIGFVLISRSFFIKIVDQKGLEVTSSNPVNNLF